MKPTFTLPSPETGTEYHLYVSEPEAAHEPGPWPAVLFMDGDDQFTAALAAYRHARKTSAVPPLLLVGVGYGASYSKSGNHRGRDYTPTPHTDEPTSGAAEAFTRFLMETLWPELARRYPLSHTQRGLAGHSLGSLLALYALIREPLFFTQVLASAPSIWWDNRSILRLTAARHARNPVLPAKLFLSVGEEDTSSMTGDLTLLKQQLTAQGFAQLHVTSRRFPRRNHFNVINDAFLAGLIALFSDHPAAARVE